jgi:phospholipase/carboxylesterase
MKRLACFLFLCLYLSNFSQTVKTDLVYKVSLPLKKTANPPLLIMLHGYGSNEDDLLAIAKSLDERLLTFSLRAPFIAEGQGYSWYKLGFLPDKQFSYTYSETVQSREKISSFIREACRSYKADSSRVFVMGFSQGAMMAYDLALNKPESVKGVLSLSGKMLEETKKTKADAFKIADVKFFIAHGNMDNVIDFKEGEAAAQFLRSKKANVSFKSYDMPHSLNGQELRDIQAWLVAALQTEKKPEGKK